MKTQAPKYRHNTSGKNVHILAPNSGRGVGGGEGTGTGDGDGGRGAATGDGDGKGELVHGVFSGAHLEGSNKLPVVRLRQEHARLLIPVEVGPRVISPHLKVFEGSERGRRQEIYTRQAATSRVKYYCTR